MGAQNDSCPGFTCFKPREPDASAQVNDADTRGNQPVLIALYPVVVAIIIMET